jgi:hypothetical protein
MSEFLGWTAVLAAIVLVACIGKKQSTGAGVAFIVLCGAWFGSAAMSDSHSGAGGSVAAAVATDAPTDAPDAPEPGTPPLIGQEGTIGDSISGMACTATKDELHAMLDAITKNDNDGYREATADAIPLAAGERVLVLDRDGFGGLEMRMRMLSGPDAHAACWVEADTPNLFR